MQKLEEISQDPVWFYAENGKPHGPFKWTEMVMKIAASRLPDNTLVWQPAFQCWRTFADAKKTIFGVAEPAKEDQWPSDNRELASDRMSFKVIDMTPLMSKSAFFESSEICGTGFGRESTRI